MAAIRSSRLPASPGSRFTFVIRTIGWRVKPSARMQPPERSSPISDAVSREDRKPAQHAVADDRHGAALDALVVPAEAAEAAGDGGVGRHVHVLGAEPERPDAVRPARSSCRRTRPRGPSTRSSSTAWPTDSCTWSPSCSPARISVVRPCGQAGRAQQRHRLGRHPRRVAGQLEREEVLVAGLRHVAAVRGRVGADLALAAVDRHRRRCRRRTRSRAARTARPRCWRTPCRSRTAEKRARVSVDARLGAEPGVGGHEHGELLLERHLERVALEAARPLAAGGRLGGERRGVRHRRLRLGDGERARQRRLGVGAGRCRAPPRSPTPRARARGSRSPRSRASRAGRGGRCGSRAVRPWNARSARRHSRRALALNPSTP